MGSGPLCRLDMTVEVCWELLAQAVTSSSPGRESAVSILQSHLWGEDWNTAEGKDGGIQVPYVSPRPRRLRNYTHCLQHPARHPGEGQPPTRDLARSPILSSPLLPTVLSASTPRIGVRMVLPGGVLGVGKTLHRRRRLG